MSPLIAGAPAATICPTRTIWSSSACSASPAILHGIKGRLARGNASSAHAAQMVERLEPLAELAWNEVQKAEL